MGDVYDKVQRDRSALEKLLDIVPGFRGYQARNTRRKADQLLRQVLSQKLANQRDRLSVAQNELIGKGRIDLVDDVGRAVTQLQTFIDRVRLATYGYAGLLDAVNINEPELEQMYNFDLQMFGYVDRLDEANDRLMEAIESGEGIEPTIRIIQGICREANETYDQRSEFALGSQPGSEGVSQ
jgi:hypothetical protein